MTVPSQSPHGSDGVDRGQLYLDFVVGIGVFLLAASFLFAFAPALFAPTETAPQDPLVADRTADRISGPMLGDASHPSVLRTGCAVAFFAQDEARCGFDPARPLTDQVGISSRYRLNVSLVRPRSGGAGRVTLCAGSGGIGPCGSTGSRAALGRPLPTHGVDVARAVRTVYVDGRDATLIVRVW